METFKFGIQLAKTRVNRLDSDTLIEVFKFRVGWVGFWGWLKVKTGMMELDWRKH